MAPRTQRIQYPVKLSGVLDESSTPRVVGDNSGHVAHSNLLYRRGGAWGIRPGFQDAYIGSVAADSGVPLTSPINAVRWYAALPTPQTQVVVGSQHGLYWGTNPNTGAPTTLTNIATSTSIPFPGQQVSFAPVYDTTIQKDILVICGFTTSVTPIPVPSASINGPTGIGVGTVFSAGDVLTVTIGGVVVTYTVTQADNTESVSTNIATLLNDTLTLKSIISQATMLIAPGNAPYVGFTAANASVSTSNTVQITSTNGGFNGGPKTARNFSAPAASPGPYKWDGTTLSMLSGPASWLLFGSDIPSGGTTANTPAGCVSWHNHVWYWGGQLSAGSLYASDINQPENFSFMLQNGPYVIGEGDGDPYIQACVPIGNILYVFKSRTVYAITGYDFQVGEYAFNVQPALYGTGIPSPGCVATLRDALVFWNGSSFRRLAPGSLETEDIGLPIALSQGSFTTKGAAQFVQAVGGSFQVQTLLSDAFASPATLALNNCAYFVMSTSATGGATTIMVYDDDASQYLGSYAWSSWSLPVANPPTTYSSVVAFGGDLDSTQTFIEPPTLFLTGARNALLVPVLSEFGTSSTQDNSGNITFTVTTGWITCGTPALTKELHQIYLEVQGTPGVQITMSVRPSYYQEKSGIQQAYAAQNIPLAVTANTIGTPEQYQVLQGNVEPALPANAFQFVISWTTTATAQCELVGLILDFVEQTFTP